MTIEKVTRLVGIAIRRKELQSGDTSSFVDSGEITEDVSGKRLNIVEVHSPDKVTVHRSLWSPRLVSLGYLPTSFPHILKEEEINQFRLSSHGVISNTFQWKGIKNK